MSDLIPNDDDLYINNGESYGDTTYYPTDPVERIEDEMKEASIVAASYPVMGDICEWFEEQIDATDSRRSINAWAEAHNKDTEQVALAFDIVRELLEEKSKEWQQFKPEH